MINPAVIDKIAAQINRTPAHRWLKSEYIVYGQYAVFHRALLEADGLKPVNRRILWDMFTNNNLPTSGFTKASRIVGSTMGRFHPHGDSSISDALARMAQTFSLRVPLIDKSGSVGHTYGDQPAAPRYWEARLTKAAMELLKEAGEGAVEMIPNYDGTEQIPKILPVRWPNDLVNGTVGIAVGFASKIPAHNPDEVIDAAIATLHNPDLGVDELMKIMPGPDLPTGGEVIGVDGIRDYYTTGRGSFLTRARYKVEQLPRGRTEISFFELPYMVSAESVLEKINQIRVDRVREVTRNGKKHKETTKANPVVARNLSEAKDLSDKRHGLRFVVTTTKGGNYKALLNELFNETDLQTSFSVNCTVINQSVPQRISVLEMLRNFVDLRRDCTAARSRHRITQINARLHRLDGILAVLIDIDKAVAIIRESKDTDVARRKLMKAFRIDAGQADFILSMRLRRLTRSDSIAIQREKSDLVKERARMEQILEDPAELDRVVEADLVAVKKIISSPRRTVINGITKDQFKEDRQAVRQEIKAASSNTPCYVTLFQDGTLIRTVDAFTYGDGPRKVQYTPILDQIQVMSQDSFVIVHSDGTGHKIPVNYLTDDAPTTAEKLGVKAPTGVRVVGISKVQSGDGEVGLAIGTKGGVVKVARTDFPTSFDEFPVISLKDGDEIVGSRWVDQDTGGTLFSMVTSGGNVLLFDAAAVNPTGSKAGGVKGVQLKSSEDRVIHFNWLRNPDEDDNMVVTSTGASVKQTLLADIPRKGRGGQGVAAQLFRKGEDHLSVAYTGSAPVACKTTGAHMVVALPEVAKRSARGTEIGEKIMLGASK